ncbi:MAG: type II secretion system protein [Candidatus Wallbacteria bacterium]|nr:type II secretion system protein [Candidatus Wallbacteria bacterium]
MKKGFSLIEVAIALTLLGILCAMLVPKLLDLLHDARIRQAHSQGMNIRKITLDFQVDPLTRRPAADRGHFTKNNPLSTEISITDLIQYGYLVQQPYNPWSNPWKLRVTGVGTPTVTAYVYSYDYRGSTVEVTVGPE